MNNQQKQESSKEENLKQNEGRETIEQIQEKDINSEQQGFIAIRKLSSENKKCGNQEDVNRSNSEDGNIENFINGQFENEVKESFHNNKIGNHKQNCKVLQEFRRMNSKHILSIFNRYSINSHLFEGQNSIQQNNTTPNTPGDNQYSTSVPTSQKQQQSQSEKQMDFKVNISDFSDLLEEVFKGKVWIFSKKFDKQQFYNDSDGLQKLSVVVSDYFQHQRNTHPTDLKEATFNENEFFQILELWSSQELQLFFTTEQQFGQIDEFEELGYTSNSSKLSRNSYKQKKGSKNLEVESKIIQKYKNLLSETQTQNEKRALIKMITELSISEQEKEIDLKIDKTTRDSMKSLSINRREKSNNVTIEEDERQRNIKEVFYFYCKQGLGRGKNVTFDGVMENQSKLEIGTFFNFLKDFSIIDKNNLKKEKLVQVFKKNSSNSKELTLDDFKNVLQKLSELSLNLEADILSLFESSNIQKIQEQGGLKFLNLKIRGSLKSESLISRRYDFDNKHYISQTNQNNRTLLKRGEKEQKLSSILNSRLVDQQKTDQTQTSASELKTEISDQVKAEQKQKTINSRRNQYQRSKVISRFVQQKKPITCTWKSLESNFSVFELIDKFEFKPTDLFEENTLEDDIYLQEYKIMKKKKETKTLSSSPMKKGIQYKSKQRLSLNNQISEQHELINESKTVPVMINQSQQNNQSKKNSQISSNMYNLSSQGQLNYLNLSNNSVETDIPFQKKHSLSQRCISSEVNPLKTPFKKQELLPFQQLPQAGPFYYNQSQQFQQLLYQPLLPSYSPHLLSELRKEDAQKKFETRSSSNQLSQIKKTQDHKSQESQQYPIQYSSQQSLKISEINNEKIKSSIKKQNSDNIANYQDLNNKQQSNKPCFDLTKENKNNFLNNININNQNLNASTLQNLVTRKRGISEIPTSSQQQFIQEQKIRNIRLEKSFEIDHLQENNQRNVKRQLNFSMPSNEKINSLQKNKQIQNLSVEPFSNNQLGSGQTVTLRQQKIVETQRNRVEQIESNLRKKEQEIISNLIKAQESDKIFLSQKIFTSPQINKFYSAQKPRQARQPYLL